MSSLVEERVSEGTPQMEGTANEGISREGQDDAGLSQLQPSSRGTHSPWTFSAGQTSLHACTSHFLFSFLFLWLPSFFNQLPFDALMGLESALCGLMVGK